MINLSSHFRAVSGTGQAFQMVLVIKKPPANPGDIRNWGSILGSGRSPGGGHSNPHRSSYLENPMDRGAWRATVHGVTKSQTQLSTCQHQQEQVSDDSLRAAPSEDPVEWGTPGRHDHCLKCCQMDFPLEKTQSSKGWLLSAVLGREHGAEEKVPEEESKLSSAKLKWRLGSHTVVFRL